MLKVNLTNKEAGLFYCQTNQSSDPKLTKKYVHDTPALDIKGLTS